MKHCSPLCGSCSDSREGRAKQLYRREIKRQSTGPVGVPCEPQSLVGPWGQVRKKKKNRVIRSGILTGYFTGLQLPEGKKVKDEENGGEEVNVFGRRGDPVVSPLLAKDPYVCAKNPQCEEKSFSQWSEWGACALDAAGDDGDAAGAGGDSEACGVGTRTRTRTLTSELLEGAEPPKPSELEESQSCNIECRGPPCRLAWTKW